MCAKGTYWILDMQVVNTNTASYVLRTPDKILLAMERKKTQVSGFLSQATLSILPLSCIRGQPYVHKVRGHSEMSNQPLCRQLAETLFLYIWIFPEWGCCHTSAGHTLLHPGIPGSHDQYRHSAAPVGGRRWSKYLPLVNNPSQPTPRIDSSRNFIST